MSLGLCSVRRQHMLYSRAHKFVVFCFAQLHLQILVNYQNQGQIWNLLVLTFSKHPLHVQFDQVLAEIFEVKDKWLESFISMVIDLTERKIIEIWIFCAKSFWTNLRRNKVVWAAHLPLTLLTKCTFHNVPCLCTGFRGIGQLCTLQSLDVGQLITIQYLVTYLGQPIRTLKASNLMGRYDIRVGRYF